MNHPDRSFSFTRISSRYDLMKALFNCKWPLCHSFYHDNLLYLSDGESEDKPEYAVVTIDETEGRFRVHGREIGRITPIEMQSAEISEFLQRINADRYSAGMPVKVMAEPQWHHSCELCLLEDE